MVNSVTVSGSTLSTTISPLNSGTIYYYQITAYNGLTPGIPSIPQPNSTQYAADYSFVLIGGKIYLNGTQPAIAQTNPIDYILNNTGGNILLTNGSTLTTFQELIVTTNYILTSGNGEILTTTGQIISHI